MFVTEQNLDISKYRIVSFIDNGGFGEVYKVEEIETGKFFAAKISLLPINSNNQIEMLDLSREVNNNSGMNHPAILKFIGFSPNNFKGEPYPVILTELMENGSLSSILEMKRRVWPINGWNDTKKLMIIYGIAAGMMYLHANKILHRDLKPQNILLDEYLLPKISDFGLSKKIHSERSNFTQSGNEIKGTSAYIAPEILTENKYTESSDVYAFSLIVYEIMTLQIPFEKLMLIQICNEIVNKQNRPQFNEDIGNAYRSLIERCWSQNPDDRPTFSQIVEELENNPDFMTETVEIDEFQDYVDFIKNYESTYSNKEIIKFEKFIQNKVELAESGTFKKVDIPSIKRFIFQLKIDPKTVIDFVNPTNGKVEHDTCENLAQKAFSLDYLKTFYDKEIRDAIDPEKVAQLVFFVVDKSQSMNDNFGTDLNKLDASLKLFTKFINLCYRTRTTSLIGSILYNDSCEVMNNLNPLFFDLINRIKKGVKPTGSSKIFTAMEIAGKQIMEAIKRNKYPNATLRIIVISDGKDKCSTKEITEVSNYLLQNKIRVDSIFFSNKVVSQLVAISRFSGGNSMFIKDFEEGLELFNKEEFFNVKIRYFGPFRSSKVTENEIKNLSPLKANDLDREIGVKKNKYANRKKIVTSPLYQISENEKIVRSYYEYGEKVHFPHPNYRRIILELQKIVMNPDEDIHVFPLKDRGDVWRVLFRGPENSLYDNFWFLIIVEFPEEYPQHYPIFRFADPPFHPNITDRGMIVMNSLDQNYRSDMSMLQLFGYIKQLLLNPDFDISVDLKREKMRGNDLEFVSKVDEWNHQNGKESIDDWLNDWKFQPDDNLLQRIKISPMF